MADEEAEEEEQKLLGKRYLFPVISTDIDDKCDSTGAPPLFPSATVSCSPKREPLDWLYNKSYKDVVEVDSRCVESEKVKEPDPNYDSSESLSSTDDESNKRAKLEKMEQKYEKKHHKKQKTKKHKKYKHKKRKYNENVKSKEEQKLMKLPSTIWIEESGLDLEKAFRIHKKPDHDNISFGGLYRLDIALHKINPKLKCLGLGPGQVVNIEGKCKKKEKHRESQERYWGNGSLFSSDCTLVPCQGMSDKGSYGFSKNFSYVPLELPSSAGARGDNNTDESPSSHGEQQVSTELLSETKDLNKRVREDPGDTEAWLALADLQSKQVQHGELISDTMSQAGLERHKKSSKLALEKKAAVLEQAVEKNPSCVDLIVAHMNVCMETTSSEKIAEKWKKVLFTQPQKTILWKRYLMFCQSNFSSFSFSNTLTVYSKCFNTLSAIKDGVFKSHSPEADIENGMVEIFVQFCQFLRQAGHMEKAIAAFQALIEFNCFYPKSLGEDHSTASAISFFETFWDSDVPRFGENNACGWNNWMENNPANPGISLNELFTSDAAHVKKNDAEQDVIITSGQDKAMTWVHLETFRETEQWQPKQTNNESDEQEELDTEDPDRVVLFQDISSALFRISHDTLKFQLLCYFLAFLGVGVELRSSDSCNVNPKDLLQVLLEDDKQLERFDSREGWRFSCWWTQYERTRNDISCNDSTTPVLRMFIRNIFSQVMQAFCGELQSTLVCHWLRFERDILLAETNPKQRKQCYKAMRKLAKSLLKMEQYCNNLRLWMAFVEIEWAFGNTDEARRIAFSSLEQTRALASVDSNTKATRYSFVRSYCEMEMGLYNPSLQAPEETDLMEEEKKNRILGAITMAVGNGTVSSLESVATPSSMLKMHRNLQEISTLMLTELQKWNITEDEERYGRSLVDFMICYTLFEYWSLGIDAARSVLDSLLSAIAQGMSASSEHHLSGSKYHEEILVFYCRLLQFHSKHGVCPVKPLRNLLLSALATFQENAFFLQSYVTLELKSCVATSVRRFFDRVLPNSQTPVPWLFAVLYEKRRRKAILSINEKSSELFSGDTKKNSPSTVTVFPTSGIVNRMRSLYEKAILHHSARHCVALWRSYMNFEAENGDLRQAKAIFYQSLQCCAWAKVLYVDAARLFPESLQDLHDMMEEKELRIRTPLEELDLLLET